MKLGKRAKMSKSIIVIQKASSEITDDFQIVHRVMDNSQEIEELVCALNLQEISTIKQKNR